MRVFHKDIGDKDLNFPLESIYAGV